MKYRWQDNEFKLINKRVAGGAAEETKQLHCRRLHGVIQYCDNLMSQERNLRANVRRFAKAIPLSFPTLFLVA
ncbi:MAG: hypothetical protein CL912_30800 [Deltaproteobacteria bacterium]|nr:hypothetical protein [Deltaproteobacteria bacterium]